MPFRRSRLFDRLIGALVDVGEASGIARGFGKVSNAGTNAGIVLEREISFLQAVDWRHKTEPCRASWRRWNRMQQGGNRNGGG